MLSPTSGLKPTTSWDACAFELLSKLAARTFCKWRAGLRSTGLLSLWGVIAFSDFTSMYTLEAYPHWREREAVSINADVVADAGV